MNGKLKNKEFIYVKKSINYGIIDNNNISKLLLSYFKRLKCGFP